MIKILFVSIILCGLGSDLKTFAQKSKREKVVTIEGLGVGYFINLQSEFELLKIDSTQIMFRMGVGSHLKAPNVYRPLTLSAGFNTIRPWRHNKMDLGIGLSYIRGINNAYVSVNNSYPSSAIYLTPNIGIRSTTVINGLIFKFFYSPLFVVKDLYDAEDYARFAISDEEYNQRPAEYAQMTKGQYLSATFSSRVGISPKAWHQPFWFGLGIGKSF